jgi:hypothetical protein
VEKINAVIGQQPIPARKHTAAFEGSNDHRSRHESANGDAVHGKKIWRPHSHLPASAKLALSHAYGNANRPHPVRAIKILL